MVLAGVAKLSHSQAHIEANVCALAQALLQVGLSLSVPPWCSPG